jgi:hypothetical protein
MARRIRRIVRAGRVWRVVRAGRIRMTRRVRRIRMIGRMPTIGFARGCVSGESVGEYCGLGRGLMAF